MNKAFRYSLLLPVLLLSLAPAATAGESAISTMAGIIMHLNHYPSDSEKETLAGIMRDEDATAGEKVLAEALKNMRHKVGESDAEKLRALSGDKMASTRERELADILLGLAHHPSAADKERLRALMDH